MIARNPKYKPLYTSKKRYFLLTGGRASAKSFETSTFLSLLTYEQMHRILFTRWTMTSAHISIIPEFTSKLAMMNCEHHFNVNRTEITNIATGSDIMFRGIKTGQGTQTANLKSIQGVTTWVNDESEELFDLDVIETIDYSIRHAKKQNRIIWLMNPSNTEHPLYQKFIEPSHKIIEIEGVKIPISTHPDVCHLHTTYLDNKHNLPPQYLAAIEHMRENDFNRYAHLFLGTWLNARDGAIFSNWKEGAFDDSLPYCYGQDYGFTIDPTTLIRVAVCEKRKHIYMHEELYTQNPLGTDEILKINQERIKNPHDLVIGDSAEGRLISELRQKGLNILPAEKGPGSVREGITSMQGYKIIVTPESANIKKELKNYIWNDKKAGIPVDDYNHTIDAARYAFKQLARPKMFFGG